MVYTPGGSKGCWTCRKRKIGCDLGRPECQRCFTTGRKCSGYGQKRNFVVATAKDQSRIAPRPRRQRSNAGHAVQTATNKAICRSPNPRAAYCDLLNEPFREVFDPRNKEPALVKFLPCGWLRLMPVLFHGRNDLLNDSLLALYTGFIGSHKQDPRMKHISLQLYSNALTSLRQKHSLSYQRDFSDIDVLLASVIILSRCEILASDKDGDGHMVHIRAGMAILKRSASTLPSSPFTKIIVRKFRCLGFYDAIRSRQAFFMSSPPFDTLFLVERQDKDYYTQGCLESVILMPSIMEAADKLDKSQLESQEEKRNAEILASGLLQLAHNMNKKFLHWFTEARAIIEPPSRSGTITLQTTRQLEFSPPHLHYRSPDDGDLWALYWSISLYLYELINQIQTRLSSIQPETSTPQLLQEKGKDRATLDTYAENICGSVFAGLRSCPFTVHETVIAMYAAQWYYRRHDEKEKLLWCNEVIVLLNRDGESTACDKPKWSSVIFQ
ncbi:hypothetical protein F5884DRAFT_469795 [Xylogone sp. PMI_703]|nr:hypothetical protein F5884DRAFT_469795 [Xylogone sp. PMI_703]